MEDAERYKEALEFLQGRFEWGVAEAVAHYYARAIDYLFEGMTWDEALDFEDDGDDED